LREARAISGIRNQESEDKNRETRIRAKKFCKYRPFASFAFFAVEIGFHPIPENGQETEHGPIGEWRYPVKPVRPAVARRHPKCPKTAIFTPARSRNRPYGKTRGVPGHGGLLYWRIEMRNFAIISEACVPPIPAKQSPASFQRIRNRWASFLSPTYTAEGGG
jgi:hypothetical protein